MGRERNLLLPIEFGLGDYFDLEAGIVGRPLLHPTLQLLHLVQQPTQRVGLANHKWEARTREKERKRKKESISPRREKRRTCGIGPVRKVKEMYGRRWRGQSDEARVQPKGTPLQRSVRRGALGRGTSCTGLWRGARAGGEGERREADARVEWFCSGARGRARRWSAIGRQNLLPSGSGGVV
jgi:hypothetical protein